jgi:hypothetical protein
LLVVLTLLSEKEGSQVVVAVSKSIDETHVNLCLS